VDQLENGLAVCGLFLAKFTSLGSKKRAWLRQFHSESILSHVFREKMGSSKRFPLLMIRLLVHLLFKGTVNPAGYFISEKVSMLVVTF